MDTGLYFHIPFCRSRCGYCDFVTFAGFERLIPEYMSALKRQASLVGAGQKVKTIFFGGGTPSLIPVEEYQKLFETIYVRYEVSEDAEITIEANPGTVSIETLKGYREVGFNRISFGMQSANLAELKLLERLHRFEDVVSAVDGARTAGFDNINLDLIMGLPGQSLKSWKSSLQKALNLKPEHLSIYSLIVEEKTPIEQKIQAGLLAGIDDDEAATQYEWTCQELERSGYVHYELSNWALKSAKQDFRCKHNLQYWRLLPYYGFGCGAVGFLPGDHRTGRKSLIMQNEPWINRYIKQVDLVSANGNTKDLFKTVSEEYEKETRLFMGFRLLDEGIDPDEFHARFGVSLKSAFGTKLQKLMNENLIEISESGNYRLKKSAWLISNRVFREFASEDL